MHRAHKQNVTMRGSLSVPSTDAWSAYSYPPKATKLAAYCTPASNGKIKINVEASVDVDTQSTWKWMTMASGRAAH